MTGTYRAVEVSAPGTLQVVERALVEPGKVRSGFGVDACGVCHTDAATVSLYTKTSCARRKRAPTPPRRPLADDCK
jgi:propanol-preferring alcohol dehydrogenase